MRILSLTPLLALAEVQYTGFERNNVELFLNVQYGQDTGGANRFKQPQPFVPETGKNYDATMGGPACPQSFGQWFPPLVLGTITNISEDCLNLNIARPKGMDKGAGLPVMVWIHGGSFWAGSNMEPSHTPDGLVLQSVANGLPVIHVAMNYRLGFFGFAQSDALKKERSENAGLRDQRLAIEWVRDNIQHFGGDGNRITIFGQSSGGLACGMHIMAYGGTKPLPYQQGICESQTLEPGITGNWSIDAMSRVTSYVGCNCSSVHSPETISCLRRLDTETLFNASYKTYIADGKHNLGDIWLPVVDGDFLPAAPSQLIREGRFGNATYMMGYTDGDVNFYTDFGIATWEDAFTFLQGYMPFVPALAIRELLDLYPADEFMPGPPSTNLTVEFFRAARVFRDVLMTCEPILLAEAMHTKGLPVYLYDFNQTILEPILAKEYGINKTGVIHTSEFAYIYGNLSHWNISNYPFDPTPSDHELLIRASRSWSTFASLGKPSAEGKETLQGWEEAFATPSNMQLFTIGGPAEGLSTFDGAGSKDEIRKQQLKKRCSFINTPEMIEWLQF
ncbi:putative lipase [Amniculicola lignicola CBS 123094]|uniref:Carboxylic ester hydrolase n=1 Tax=Amniculicola lignicola CBS 123094 TaxID=1392246 RepID=A0A6A5VZR4_9PLEO|nr:putative lipase [Amniculicola lignicola CBS 123094]